MPRAKIDSIEIQYEISGYGPPVVFINGLTMDLNGWLLQIDAFSKKYRMVRYDCRGQGDSDKPDSEYTQELHADDLAGLLKHLGLEHVSVAGLSMGGYIAFALLCEELERADTAFRVVQSVHVGLNSLTLLQWATEEQRQRWLVPQAKGEKLATAVDHVLRKILKPDDGGLIAVSKTGEVVMDFTTDGMARAAVDAAGVRTIKLGK